MLEDQGHDQVGCWHCLPGDQSAGEAADHCLARTTLHFGHRGGCTSNPLDHTVDLQASGLELTTGDEALAAALMTAL